MELRREIIPHEVIETGIASLEKRVDDLAVFRWMLSFLSGSGRLADRREAAADD